jgi:signal transduction histidine kinase
LFLYVQVRGVRTSRLWLSLTILLGAAVTGAALLPANVVITENITRGLVIALALSALLVAFGALVIHDTAAPDERRLFPMRWLLFGILWLGLLIGTALTSGNAGVGEGEWLLHVFTEPTALGVITLAGFALLSVILLGTAFAAFYNATLPEVANRALFWVLVIAVILMGIVLFVSGAPALTVVGSLTVLFGIAGATYAQMSYRVLDIRSELGTAAQAVILLVLTTAVIFVGIALTANLDLGAQGVVPMIALAAVLASLYLLLYHLAVLVSTRLSGTPYTDPAEATRQYSLQISNALELDSLVEIATRTINTVLRVRRSALVVVSAIEGSNTALELHMMPHTSEVKSPRSNLLTGSPLYHQFAIAQAPVSQFELQFNPRFKSVPESEQQYFRDTGMSAYAPIIAENRLIGILACSTKADDAQFYPRDLKLLATLANQTGTALRNARLVADLRRLNASAQALNTNLEAAKDQMEKLDSVKTDFITIASHELRTPLAQIRGYTDIMDAMNEEGMLESDQIAGMVNNLRKATERMEELITAMLDVSQLDVDAMDLSFAQTSLESVVRMAIEPLTDAIRQRKLTVSARGLRGLPAIQGDLQRLVQAVRNVVINAIKFTPDGGRIEITGNLRPASRPGEKDHVHIAITDTGVGIDKDNLELIFRKFYRAYDPTLHSTGAYKFMGAGPGLGLTIAKGIVEGHGGEIWAESNLHSTETFPGSSFYILLPVTPPETAGRVKPFEGDLPEAISQEPTLVRSQL